MSVVVEVELVGTAVLDDESSVVSVDTVVKFCDCDGIVLVLDVTFAPVNVNTHVGRTVSVWTAVTVTIVYGSYCVRKPGLAETEKTLDMPPRSQRLSGRDLAQI